MEKLDIGVRLLKMTDSLHKLAKEMDKLYSEIIEPCTDDERNYIIKKFHEDTDHGKR
jgi:hypothetical protein